jgi:hypothetical protein
LGSVSKLVSGLGFFRGSERREKVWNGLGWSVLADSGFDEFSKISCSEKTKLLYIRKISFVLCFCAVAFSRFWRILLGWHAQNP